MLLQSFRHDIIETCLHIELFAALSIYVIVSLWNPHAFKFSYFQCLGIWSLMLLMKITVNPYKPSVPFLGHRQTVQTQIRCRRTRHLIRVYTVCLQEILLKMKSKYKKMHQTPLNSEMDSSSWYGWTVPLVMYGLKWQLTVIIFWSFQGKTKDGSQTPEYGVWHKTAKVDR